MADIVIAFIAVIGALFFGLAAIAIIKAGDVEDEVVPDSPGESEAL